MSSSSYFSNGPQVSNGNRSPGLPVYSTSSFSSSAVREKLGLRNPSPWFISIQLPGRIRLLFLNPRRLHQFSVSRFGRVKGSVILSLGFLALFLVFFALAKRFGTREKRWPRPFGPPSTLVYRREDLQRIWQWEIASGHYPSHRPIPEQLRFQVPPVNPRLPSHAQTPLHPFSNTTRGIGTKRTYLDLSTRPPNVAYPRRPVPGSVADLDVVMEHCDFSEKKYVRDCLEVLRVGAGLDSGNRFRRGDLDDWNYIYMEAAYPANYARSEEIDVMTPSVKADVKGDPDVGLVKIGEWEASPIVLPSVPDYRPYASLSAPCDPDSPRLFHMFWTGPFTDKPYTALLSFLYTQNTGLHLQFPPDATVCRPQFWMWINPGPAAAVPNPSATQEMFSQLKANSWAAPFLHPRFKDVIKFKLWNTTEQLDEIPELKDEWRKRDLFNSGGHIIPVPPSNKSNGSSSAQLSGTPATSRNSHSGNILNRAGSTSSSTYDRLSVILSDMARFILCHRFGGIYLDADTIVLRDWEELWGWRGAFAYRWSRLKRYNTAVLHLNKGSALGQFIFRTALKNDLDFHPMTISRYMEDAYLEGLLLRLPDALFDSAWLNTEYYQRDRPPQPYFTDFADFFETPVISSAAPQAFGFDGFFKGAFSYHFHNFWWKPFDPTRNWPDLGKEHVANATAGRIDHTGEKQQADVGDKRDLDWATVLKRTFEAYIRGERPNMYGEWLQW